MKHEFGEAKVENTPPSKKPTLPGPVSVQNDSLTNTKFCNYLHMVKETELKISKKIGLSLLLPQKTDKELKCAVLHDHN